MHLPFCSRSIGPRSLACVGLMLLLAALTPGARGAVKIWSGGGGNNNWTTGGNWGGTPPSAGDDLVFPAGAARLSNTNDFASGTGFYLL